MTCQYCNTVGNYWVAHYIDGRSAAICNGCGIHMAFLHPEVTGDTVLNFGQKHRGWKLKDVPVAYLSWMLREGHAGEMREWIAGRVEEAK